MELWIAPRKEDAVVDVAVLDTLPSKAAVDLSERKLHSAEVDPLGPADVHGSRCGLHALDHLSNEMILGRDHVVFPQHDQLTLHGLDVGLRNAGVPPADAI